jgi:hypothetical protein
MADSRYSQVRVETQGRVPERMPELAAAKVESLLRLAPEPVLSVRVTLTMAADPAVELPAIARANLDLDGHLICAQAAGKTMRESVGRMTSWLRTRLERAARNWEDRRGARPTDIPGEWRHQSTPVGHPPYFPRPAGERQVIRRRSFAVRRQAPGEALADLDLLDYDFHLFTDRTTGQDSVLYRAADGYCLTQAGPAAAHAALPATVKLAAEPVPVLTVGDAIARLEALGREFLFFLDTGTGRGSVVYHRYDGHYGLIVPADAPRDPVGTVGLPIGK